MSSGEKQDLGHFLTNLFGDRYLYAVNRTAFDAVGSEVLYADFLGKMFLRENSLTILIGTDSGLLLKHLGQQKLPAGSRFLFIELPEVIEKLKGSGLIEEMESRIAVVPYGDWLEKVDEFRLREYVYLARVEFIESVGAVDAYLPEYREIAWLVKQELQDRTWNLRFELGNAVFIQRQFHNLAENRMPARLLANSFNNGTGIILGGGPSLDEALPWVKENQHRIVILAVSRVCRQLLDHGITPHMVFSVDPQHESFELAREMFRFAEKTLFVHAYHAASALVSQWPGRSVYLGPRLPWKTPLNEETLPMAGPTVTNTALAAATGMGFARLILAGVDFCHSREGFCHAKGSAEAAVGPRLGQFSPTVETNGGWWAETSPDLACALETMGQQAERALKQGCQVIHFAAGAARIPHVKHLPLQQIDLQDLEESPSLTIAKMLGRDDAAKKVAHYRAMAEELAKAEKRLCQIKTLADEALACNDGLFGRNGKQIDFKYKNRMDKIERTLNKDFKELIPLVKGFGLGRFVEIVRPVEEMEWSDEEIERVGRIYYESYRESARQLIRLIGASRKRLRARLEEESTSPDPGLLFKQWREDGQPGRLAVWRNNHPDRVQGLDRVLHQEIAELEASFAAIMTETETTVVRRVRRLNDLSGVQGKIQVLAKRRDLAGLERLVQGLEEHSDGVNARPLLCLSRGYLAEFDGDFQKALAEYQSIIDGEFHATTEDALRRIVFISLEQEDFANALLALECLSGISPVYLPQYADLLKICGNYQASAAAYNEYLTRVPEDRAAMLKLGRLYKDLGYGEAARMAFGFVLEQDPNSGAARLLLQGLNRQKTV